MVRVIFELSEIRQGEPPAPTIASPLAHPSPTPWIGAGDGGT